MAGRGRVDSDTADVKVSPSPSSSVAAVIETTVRVRLLLLLIKCASITSAPLPHLGLTLVVSFHLCAIESECEIDFSVGDIGAGERGSSM